MKPITRRAPMGSISEPIRGTQTATITLCTVKANETAVDMECLGDRFEEGSKR